MIHIRYDHPLAGPHLFAKCDGCGDLDRDSFQLGDTDGAATLARLRAVHQDGWAERVDGRFLRLLCPPCQQVERLAA